jgi:hypothetical protein
MKVYQEGKEAQPSALTQTPGRMVATHTRSSAERIATTVIPDTYLTRLNQTTQVSAGRNFCAKAIAMGLEIHID